MNELENEISALATRIVQLGTEKGMTLATAESCTGGLVGGAITRVPGSSKIYDRGFITYSNTAKIDLLKIEPETLEEYGAVSQSIAEEMAIGALGQSGVDIAVSVTGIAGPGGSEHKPAGLVWFGLATRHGSIQSVRKNWGDIGRDAVRQNAVHQALTLLLSGLEGF